MHRSLSSRETGRERNDKKKSFKARTIELCFPDREDGLVDVPFLNSLSRGPVSLPRNFLGEGDFLLASRKK